MGTIKERHYVYTPFFTQCLLLWYIRDVFHFIKTGQWMVNLILNTLYHIWSGPVRRIILQNFYTIVILACNCKFAVCSYLQVFNQAFNVEANEFIRYYCNHIQYLDILFWSVLMWNSSWHIYLSYMAKKILKVTVRITEITKYKWGWFTGSPAFNKRTPESHWSPVTVKYMLDWVPAPLRNPVWTFIK